MSSPRASAEGPASGDQRTPVSAEVDPIVKRRSTELEQYGMRDARSDKLTQTTITAQVLPSMPGLEEKGHGNPDHHPPDPHASRHNSVDSNAGSVGGSSYYSAPSPGNKIKRSSTGWTSVATTSTVASSIIEEEEEEPDVLSLKEEAEEPFGLDGPFGPDERYASSDSPQGTPSQGGNEFEFKRFFGRSFTYQSPTPSRSSSINEDLDLAASSTHKAHPFSSSPRPNSPAQRVATMPKYKRDKAPMGLRLDSSVLRRDSLPLRSRVEHPSPSRIRRRATDQLCGPSAVGVGTPRAHSKLAQDWEPASSPTNPTTPGSEAAEGEEEDDTVMDESELPTPLPDPDEHMAGGDSGDGSSDCGSLPGTPPSLEDNTPVGSPKSDSSSPPHRHHDQDTVGDICDLILERTHGVRLRDLTMSDDAWEAVNYCLEELERIVDANAALPGQTSIPIRETPAGRSQGGPSGYGQWNNYSSGSGSQGGHNGGHDGQLPQGNHGGGYGLDGSGGGAGQEGNGESKPPGKRNRDSDIFQGQYSCPYRKRHPAKFNVRDHLTCATQSFPDISQVKRHVKTFHRRNIGRFQCIRCMQSFQADSHLRLHLQKDSEKMCKVMDQAEEETNGDPELGVSSGIIDELNERKQNSKVDTWDGLWKKLFPLDEEPREPTFIPPVELDEVKVDFAMMINSLNAEIRTRVGALGLGKDAARIGDSVTQVCVQRINDTLRISENRASGGVPNPKRRRPQPSGKRSPAGSTRLHAEHSGLAARGMGSSSNSSNLGSSPVDLGEPPELVELGELEVAQYGQPQGPSPHVMPVFSQPGFPLMANAHQPVGVGMSTTVPLVGHLGMGSQNGSDNSKSASPANSHEAAYVIPAMGPQGGLAPGYVDAQYWPTGPFSDSTGFDGSFPENSDFNSTWDKENF